MEYNLIDNKTQNEPLMGLGNGAQLAQRVLPLPRWSIPGKHQDNMLISIYFRIWMPTGTAGRPAGRRRFARKFPTATNNYFSIKIRMLEDETRGMGVLYFLFPQNWGWHQNPWIRKRRCNWFCGEEGLAGMQGRQIDRATTQQTRGNGAGTLKAEIPGEGISSLNLRTTYRTVSRKKGQLKQGGGKKRLRPERTSGRSSGSDIYLVHLQRPASRIMRSAAEPGGQGDQ